MDHVAARRLSASLEDYLEVIFWEVAATGRARPREIAKRLNARVSSVTGALQALAEREYVRYEPYEVITLTRTGFDAGARVARRHHILRIHLAELLGVDEATADQGACRLEHGIPPVVVDRLAQFHVFIKSLPTDCRERVMSFAQQSRLERLATEVDALEITVADLKAGQQGVITVVKGNGYISRRLTEKGLGRGALIQVEAIDAGGTPIQVAIREQRLVLCRNDAENIVVIGR